MKKFALILLTAVYALAVLGASPVAGYCCDEPASTDNNFTCCNNQSPVSAFIPYHIVSKSAHVTVRDLNSLYPVFPFAALANHTSTEVSSVTWAVTPSAPDSIPIYIFHCVYLI
ncbi:MAG: hypothetical protein ABIU63_13415 [Chitinophagaceae bacterium]